MVELSPPAATVSPGRELKLTETTGVPDKTGRGGAIDSHLAGDARQREERLIVPLVSESDGAPSVGVRGENGGAKRARARIVEVGHRVSGCHRLAGQEHERKDQSEKVSSFGRGAIANRSLRSIATERWQALFAVEAWC